MKHLCVSGCVVCMLGLLSLFPSTADAVVAMSASSAMRGDNFVGNSGVTSGGGFSNSSAGAKEEREQSAADARARRKELHEQILEKSRSGKLNSLVTISPSKAAKEIMPAEETQNKEETPAVNAVPVSEYNKKYASKFFKTISGHITIEQKNLPRKISVSKGSVIELHLKGSEDTFWFLSTNEKSVKVEKNKFENGQTVVVLSAAGKGASRIIMDYISKKSSNYKVLATKKFIVLVD